MRSVRIVLHKGSDRVRLYSFLRVLKTHAEAAHVKELIGGGREGYKAKPSVIAIVEPVV